MHKDSLSKDRSATIDSTNQKLHSINYETASQSPGNLHKISSVKNADYRTEVHGSRVLDNSLDASMETSKFKMPVLKSSNILRNASISPRRLTLK